MLQPRVAAGIAIRQREHIDAVEFLARGDYPAGAGDHRAAKRCGGDGRLDRGIWHAGSLRPAALRRLLRRSNATMSAAAASTL